MDRNGLMQCNAVLVMYKLNLATKRVELYPTNIIKTYNNGVFPKWNRTFTEFGEFSKSLNHPVSHLCLAGAVVASWSLTQEVAGSSPFK